jgi:predicted transcriptional regulator
MRPLRGLKIHRLAAGYSTQGALARELGVTRQLIAKLEAGQIAPRLDLARRLVQILEADDLEALFPSEPDPPRRRRRLGAMAMGARG